MCSTLHSFSLLFILIWLFLSKLFCAFSKNHQKTQGHFCLSIAFSPEHTPPDEDKEIKPPEKSTTRVNASAQASKSNIEELSEETPIVGSMSEAQAAKRLISPEEQVRKRGFSSNNWKVVNKTGR